LIGYYHLIHNATHDAENPSVKEEFRGEAGRLKRHRQKVTMLAAVRLAVISR
jgi:hypothetical protein